MQKIAMNTMTEPHLKMGHVIESDLSKYDELIRETWLCRKIDAIRAGKEELKKSLPFRCAHYYRFKDNHRSQATLDPEAFLFQTTVDVDDAALVPVALERAQVLNDDTDSPWFGLLLHLEYSARGKLHIDIRLPVGMTIQEAQLAYCEALGIAYDASCISPERMIYITDYRQEIFRSEHWYEVLPEDELARHRQAYAERGLGADGRKLMQNAECRMQNCSISVIPSSPSVILKGVNEMSSHTGIQSPPSVILKGVNEVSPHTVIQSGMNAVNEAKDLNRSDASPTKDSSCGMDRLAAPLQSDTRPSGPQKILPPLGRQDDKGGNGPQSTPSVIQSGMNAVNEAKDPVQPRMETPPDGLRTSYIVHRTFKGIPYGMVIEQLLNSMGYDNIPAEGERNNALYSLVRNLRYICDFDAAKILQVLPDWGLPDAEVRTTVLSALNTVRKTVMPEVLKRIIDRLQQEYELLNNGASDSEPTKQQNRIYELPKLPRLLTLIVRAFPAEYRPPVLVSSIVFLGALLTRVRATYLDGSVHSPSFLACVVAPQASGKSFTRRLYDIITEPIFLADKAAREVDKAYQEAKRSAKNAKKQPEDPKAVIRLIPATASNAMILKRADYANGQHLCTYAEEIDTMTKANKAGAWSQKSDLLRMAFDNAQWGQDYMSDNSYSGLVKLYYNILCCGTPNAVNRYFRDVEDGLVSRFIFCRLPDMLGDRIPKFGTYSPKERTEIRRMLQQLYDEQNSITDVQLEDGRHVQRMFQEDTDAQWVRSNTLNRCIEDWLEAKRLEFLQDQDNKALEVFRRRAAVIGFRTGLVLYKLCNDTMGKVALDGAIWMADYVLQQQLDIFGDQMNKVMNDNENSNYAMNQSAPRAKSASTRFLDILPQEFTWTDVMRYRSSFCHTSNPHYVICRWVKNGLVQKVDTDRWRKSI